MNRTQHTNRFLCSAVALLVFTVTAAVQAQTTINVPGDQPTIQAGIDAAQNGDTVLVAPGEYNEAINLLGKAIHVRSSDGPETTSIDASGLSTSVVTCASGEGPNTSLEGFTITGGNASAGGGMRNIGTSPTVINCTFIGNSANSGGAMSNGNGSDVTVIDSRFENNTASGSGGAVDNFFMSSASFENCLFAGNSASIGGAIANSFFTSCNSHVSGTTFCENVPDNVAGTWHDEGGNEFLRNCPEDEIVGDLNGDGVVNVLDLLILLEAWGECADPDDCPADLNDDGEVNVLDLLILLENWG